MANQLNPYLHFNDGKAREAMTFYQSVFGGDLDVMTFGDQGMDGPDADNVMHSYMDAPPIAIMGSDAPPGQPLREGDSVRLSLSGDGGDDLRSWFSALSEGGEVHVPLEKQSWGDEFGQVADKFGVVWLVNITQSNFQERAREAATD